MSTCWLSVKFWLVAIYREAMSVGGWIDHKRQGGGGQDVGGPNEEVEQRSGQTKETTC